MIIAAQTTGYLSTSNPKWTVIPGLSFNLPKGFGEALLILNLPYPYATGSDYPGGTFGIQIISKVQSTIAGFTYGTVSSGNSPARVPTTLCVATPLSPSADTAVAAVWQNVRRSTVIIDTPATLTAVVQQRP